MSEQALTEYVAYVNSAWHVFSKTGKHLGGPYKTKGEAVERLRQIEGHKKD